jgi:hypothetical protein
VRPTPRSRLPHSVSYSKFDDSGRDNDYDTAVTVTYVRVEENSTLIRDNNGNILKGATLLIYDNTTSAPTGLVFAEQDKVAINVGEANEKALRVVATADVSGNVSHHQEVILQ